MASTSSPEALLPKMGNFEGYYCVLIPNHESTAFLAADDANDAPVDANFEDVHNNHDAGPPEDTEMGGAADRVDGIHGSTTIDFQQPRSQPSTSLLQDSTSTPLDLHASITHTPGQHANLTTNNTRPVNCPVCDKVIKRASSLPLHMRIHEAHPWKCHVQGCQEYFRTEEHLVRHLNYRHPRSPLSAMWRKCPFEVCDFSFSELQEDDLREHLTSAHGRGDAEGGEGEDGNDGLGGGGVGDGYNHPSVGHDAATGTFGEAQPPHDGASGVDGDQDMHDAEDVEVSIPNAVMDSVATDTQQPNSTLEARSDEFFRGTNRDSGLQDSLTEESTTTARPGTVSFIDLTAPAAENASLDIQHEHIVATNSAAEWPHKCSTCGKSYKRKAILTRHEELHAGQKWPCPVPTCNRHQKPFDTHDYCQRHVRAKHPKYRCLQPTCLFVSLRQEDVARHVKQAHSGGDGMVWIAPKVGGSSGSGGADVGTGTGQMTLGEGNSDAIALATTEAAETLGGGENEVWVPSTIDEWMQATGGLGGLPYVLSP
ncbi:hypothetical protein LTR37_004705 [Vermiconidia calcicola]|uniref:Uncharacterized protein n=1 Tax=Vermiconidia calcicola TaxID=1690605 RepID=A0ACC3NM06_9PEZI|nr:hypothetical protein LTR37_004705 [Vermiconidia calcicola]